MSPTQRTLAHLRKEGYLCQIVEHWNPYSHTRQDLFGFIDILAIKPNVILGVQATSTSNLSARVKKIRSTPASEVWLASGGLIKVMCWSKKGPRGKRKLWTLTEREIS